MDRVTMTMNRSGISVDRKAFAQVIRIASLRLEQEVEAWLEDYPIDYDRLLELSEDTSSALGSTLEHQSFVHLPANASTRCDMTASYTAYFFQQHAKVLGRSSPDGKGYIWNLDFIRKKLRQFQLISDALLVCAHFLPVGPPRAAEHSKTLVKNAQGFPRNLLLWDGLATFTNALDKTTQQHGYNPFVRVWPYRASALLQAVELLIRPLVWFVFCRRRVRVRLIERLSEQQIDRCPSWSGQPYQSRIAACLVFAMSFPR